MTVEADVLAAKTPRDALLVLARAVDKLQTAPTDPWAEWDDHETHIKAQVAYETQTPEAEITDDDVRGWIQKNYGIAPMDDNEGRAVIAQVRADLERAGRGEVPPDDFVMHDGVVESRIDWSPHDAEHRSARERFARNHLKLDVALGEHPEGGDWAEDYAKQGPMPMYILNRELLMGYPDSVKGAIIADIATYDVRISQEVGRDLLKAPMTKDESSPAGRLNIGDD